MTDFALGLGFILIPLALRWFTAWQMGCRRQAILGSDEACKKLAGELNEIRAAINEVERRQSFYASRRANLRSQIETAREELAELRRPTADRLAA